MHPPPDSHFGSSASSEDPAYPGSQSHYPHNQYIYASQAPSGSHPPPPHIPGHPAHPIYGVPAQIHSLTSSFTPEGVLLHTFPSLHEIDMRLYSLQSDLSARFGHGINHLLTGVNVSLRSFRRDRPRKTVIPVPRLPELSDNRREKVIPFSVCEVPGPYIQSIAGGTIVVDDANDHVFAAYGWRSTTIQFNWPGYEFPRRKLKLHAANGKPMEKGEFVSIIASQLFGFFRQVQTSKRPAGTPIVDGEADDSWDLAKIDLGRLRLLSVNYYNLDSSVQVWVPILALEF